MVGRSGVVESTITYAGADSNKGHQRALVKGNWALILEDFGCAVEGARVLRRCLQPDLDNVCAGEFHFPGW